MKQRGIGERIKALRERGYTVHIQHLRRCVGDDMGAVAFIFLTANDAHERHFAILPHGGMTLATITRSDGERIHMGTAECRFDFPKTGGVAELYDKRIGALIALGRAEKALQHGIPELPPKDKKGQRIWP